MVSCSQSLYTFIHRCIIHRYTLVYNVAILNYITCLQYRHFSSPRIYVRSSLKSSYHATTIASNSICIVTTKLRILHTLIPWLEWSVVQSHSGSIALVIWSYCGWMVKVFTSCFLKRSTFLQQKLFCVLCIVTAQEGGRPLSQ